MSLPGDDPAPTVRRRALVRAGVTAAWTTPLVVMSVPAYAATCSGGPVQLLATEVFGSSGQIYTPSADFLTVQVRVMLTNSGAAGHLVSASITGAAAETLSVFTLGAATYADIGIATAVPGVSTLTVTAPGDVPIGTQGQEFWIQYQFTPGLGMHTMSVTFVPDCGDPAVCPIITTVAG